MFLQKSGDTTYCLTRTFTGRYVFGAAPSNPQLLHWMIHEFEDVPLLPVDGKPKIRFSKRKVNSRILKIFFTYTSNFTKKKTPDLINKMEVFYKI